MANCIETLPRNIYDHTNNIPDYELVEEEIKTVFTIAKTIVGPQQDLLLYGGTVRNLLLNKTTSNPDYDFIGNFDPEKIQDLFPELVSDRWDDVSTIRLRIGNDDYDFTWARNIPERLSIGDITVSNICMNENGQIIDPFGGIDSLVNKEIKVLDPDEKFLKNPARILRVLRFAGELDFTIEEETWESLLKNAHLLSLTPNIEDELLKILSLDDITQERILSNFDTIGINEHLLDTLHTREESEARILEKNLCKIQEIELLKNLFNTEVYLVGGAIRDTIWRKRINDFDFKVFLPVEKMIGILERSGFTKREDYKIKPGQYYISSFPGVLGFNAGGLDIHLSEANSPDINDMIKGGDLNLNCCAYDLHKGKILNPEYINEIKLKELRFANTTLAENDPSIVINALKQIAKLPDINIPEETESIIRRSIPKLGKYLIANPNLEYLLTPICNDLNSERALSFLGEQREELTKSIPKKKSKLKVSSKGFHSEEIKKLSKYQKEKIYEIIRSGYGKTFVPSKVFDGHSNSVIWESSKDDILSCGIIDGERLYSAAAPDRLQWIRLISEATRNNYNLWGTVGYKNTKIRALCTLAGLKVENNPTIIENILKSKAPKYANLELLNQEKTITFKKNVMDSNEPQILMRS